MHEQYQDGYKAMPIEAAAAAGSSSDTVNKLLPSHRHYLAAIGGLATVFGLVALSACTSAGKQFPTMQLSKPSSSSSTSSFAIMSYFTNSVEEKYQGEDFYAQPGMLAINRSEEIPAHQRARWLHLSELDDLEARNLTGLEAELGYEDGFSLLEEYFTSLEADDDGTVEGEDEDDPVPAADMEYLKDKTILLFGDSQDRYTIDFLCELMQGELTYRQFFTPSYPQHDLTRPSTVADWRNALHHCQLPPGLLGNTSIWSFMTYGSITKNDTYVKMRPNQGPDELLERIELAGDAFRQNNISIDMMIFHTMLWDLDTANLYDAIDNKPASSSLSIDQVQLFRRKQHEALSLVNAKFPFSSNAIKMYRTLHNTIPSQEMKFYAYAPSTAKRIPRIPLGNNKGAQLNTAMLDLIPEYGLVPFDLGRVLAGYVEDYPDTKHYGHIGRLLYTQMLLYYLRRGHH